MLSQGFCILSSQDGDAPFCPAIGTVSKDEPGDDGGFLIGLQAAENGAIWTDRFYWTGNPEPLWLAGRMDDALEAGASWSQCGNELNLELEGFEGGPEAYFALEDAVRSLVVDPARILAMPPSPGVPGWEQWVRSAGDHAIHCYGSRSQMQAIVEWYLAHTSGRVVITECNWGAGNAVDVDQWAGAELVPFLDWCNTQPRVVSCLYFAYRWRGAPPMPTPVDAAGTAVERVVTDWVPPMNGGANGTWYPGAAQMPISCNYTPGRSAGVVVAVVEHIADGYGSPFGWFDTPRGQQGSSAHFWISTRGEVEQYRPLEDTCWANGPICDPDLANPAVAGIVASGVDPNAVTVAVEHEGVPGEEFTAEQTAASRDLTAWLCAFFGVPHSRDGVIGHGQLDNCTRAYCPGPSFPWALVLEEEAPPPAFDVEAIRGELWTIKDELYAGGWPRFAQAIEAAVTQSKGEQ